MTPSMTLAYEQSRGSRQRSRLASSSATLISCSLTSVDTPAEHPPPRAHPPRPSLGQLWEGLLEGSRKVVAHAYDETHCSLAVTLREGSMVVVSELSRERRALTEDAILGHAQKALAIDLGRSSSTVSTALHGSLQGMGLSCKFRCLPLSLALLAHAVRQQDALPRPSLEREGDAWVVTLARPDRVLRTRLSGSEYEVARLVLEGKTHTEMAALRRVSVRTIANQLQSAFSKLKVSGRFELLRLSIDGRLRSVGSAL